MGYFPVGFPLRLIWSIDKEIVLKNNINFKSKAQVASLPNNRRRKYNIKKRDKYIVRLYWIIY